MGTTTTLFLIFSCFHQNNKIIIIQHAGDANKSKGSIIINIKTNQLSPLLAMIPASALKLTRGQALDVSEIDHELLKLFLPQIQSMFKYFSHTPSLHSININAIPENRYDLSSLLLSSPQAGRDAQEQQHEEGNHGERQGHHPPLHQQLQQHEYYNPSSKYVTNVVLYCLKGVMIYLTLIRHDIATPGMANLKVTFKPPSSHRIKHKNRMYRYLFLSTMLPLVYELIQWKRRIYLHEIESMTNGTRTYSNASERIGERNNVFFVRSIQRKLLILQYIVKVSSFIVPPLQFYAFVNHTWNHIFSPTPSMSFSGLQYESMPTSFSSQRNVNFSYAQRRLLYEELMLTVGMVVPLNVWKDLPKATQKCYTR